METSSRFGLSRDYILPRIVFLPYIVSVVVLSLLNIFTFKKFSRNRSRKTVLCLESGIKGWELIEYKEILGSAIDYLGEDAVCKVAIDRNKPYLPQVWHVIRTNRPTHYVYDSRTGDQNWFAGLFQSFGVAIAFQLNGVVPICTLTDLPVRAWRAQTAVVSAKRGVVVSLMSPRDIGPIFPHKRIIGPITMPFSKSSMKMLARLDKEYSDKFFKKSLIFTGSLYEPRTTLLEQIRNGLEEKNIVLEMKGRELGSQKFSDEDYWRRLASASMVITTANQIQTSYTDWAWLPHLIYRYLEVPLAGSILVAQDVPSLGRYFVPGVHFLAYNTPEEAVDKIAYYWNRPEELKEIAENGSERARSIVECNFYWLCVDAALRHDSMI